MPWGGFRSPEGEVRWPVVWLLGIGDTYAGCRQTRAVEVGKDEGGVGTEGGCNKRAGCMGGEIRALGRTRRMGSEKTSGGRSGRTGCVGWTQHVWTRVASARRKSIFCGCEEIDRGLLKSFLLPRTLVPAVCNIGERVLPTEQALSEEQNASGEGGRYTEKPLETRTV